MDVTAVVIQDGVDEVGPLTSVSHIMKKFGIVVTFLKPQLFGPRFPENLFLLVICQKAIFKVGPSVGLNLG